MGAARSKPDTDALWELVKRVGSLETLICDIDKRLRGISRTRKYYVQAIKRLRIEKQGLMKYNRELETALRVQREDEKI